MKKTIFGSGEKTNQKGLPPTMAKELA